MDVNTTKETLCVNRIVGQKSEVIFVEGDIIVPDVKPDILNAIHTTGNVCVYKKEVLDGKIRIDGNVNVYIMYLADTDNQNVRGLNTTIDFTQILDIDGCKSNMSLDENVMIKSIECKVLNGRKVSIKVSLAIEGTVYTNENIEFIKDLEQIEDIQSLRNPLQINSLIGEGCTKAFAKDTVIIENTDILAEILNVELNVVDRDVKISYNKILAKAEGCVKIMYLTEDGRICIAESRIPIMGFIDMPNVTEENDCETKYKLRNMVVKPNTEEEHSVYVEAEFELTSKVYESKEIRVIEDLYSPSKELVFNQKEVKTTTDRNHTRQMCNIREKIVIPEIEENKIYDANIRVMISNQNIIADKVMYEGEIEISFIFESNTVTRVSTAEYKLPFDFTAQISGITTNYSVMTEIEIAMQDFVVLSDGNIDTKIDLLFDISTSRTTDIKVIDEITMDETRQSDPYSMTIYFVKAGDSLWKIAKRYKSTVEEIVKINGIEDENKIYPGQQLFIPKHSLTRKEVTA